MKANSINGSIRVTIPQGMVRKLGIKPSDLMAVTYEDDIILIKKLEPKDIIIASKFMNAAHAQKKPFIKQMLKRIGELENGKHSDKRNKH
jgi:bifunctional DNA-binding transcriptional regulator/antitoxin component of YhaV-PrlF toxin-antitoxin module